MIESHYFNSNYEYFMEDYLIEFYLGIIKIRLENVKLAGWIYFDFSLIQMVFN